MSNQIVEVSEVASKLDIEVQPRADSTSAGLRNGLKYSRGNDKYDNAPEQRAAEDFDAFQVAVLADRSPRKGLGFICAPLSCGPHYQKPDKFPGEGYWRLSHYVEPSSFLCQDYDGFKNTEMFSATVTYLARYRGFGYTTASSTATEPRARAILKLSRLVSRDDCIILGQRIQAAMLAELGVDAIKFDDSVYRGEQPVYTPVTTSESFHFYGEEVDVDAWLTHPADNHAPEKATGRTPTSNVMAALMGRVFEWPEKIHDGEHREKFILRAAGHFREKGLDQSVIEGILLDYNRCHNVPPHNDDLVLDRARRYQDDAEVPVANDEVPEPKVLSENLPPVHPFHLGLLPKAIGAYVQDVAERMNCPLDFPAIAAMASLATAIGSRIHCKPYSKGTWMVPAGAWGMVVNPPSAIKSPPLSEMLRPLYVMDKDAAARHAKDMEQYQIEKQIYDNKVKAAVKAGATPTDLVAPTEPTMTRFVVNDGTYEMLVAIAAANPNGFLIWRDELVGWFHSLNKENQKEARGLYLTGWSGTEGYATDRIGRGHVRADRVNLSLLGTIQPNVLRQIVHDAVAGGGGDDGLIARFQLAVYPDPVRTYVKVDRHPDLQAMEHYEGLIRRLVALDPVSIGASFTPDGTPYLPFDEDAQVIFDDWRQQHEDRILPADSEEHPAMLAHLGKYRSLFPKLALILHLAAGKTGPICGWAANRAKAWTIYLEGHARRIYHTATNRVMQSAVALANKIKAGKLVDGFTKSDVLVKEWAGLRTADEVNTALTVLLDGNWLTVTVDRGTGGRPAGRHYISQKVKRAA